MSDQKTTTQKKKPGRKLPKGAENRRQFLAAMNRDLIKATKAVAAEEEITASEMPGRAARELLDRRKTMCFYKA